MSGEDLKPDPVFDKLGRFTPDASGIDRDEWLFQAGRASVRPWRGWRWAAVALAVAQAATLAVWAARDRPGAPPDLPTPVAAEIVPPPVEPSDPPPDSFLVYSRTTPDADPPAPMHLPPTKPLSWRSARSGELD